MDNIYEINFRKIGNKEIGHLVPLEQYREIPFEIKRIYYTYGVPESVKRGFHAHKELEQVLICLNGEIKVKCFDGKEERIFKLNNPSKGLYISSMIWREVFDYKRNAVLIVLASEYYNEKDYIRDYDKFLKLVKKDYWENENTI